MLFWSRKTKKPWKLSRSKWHENYFLHTYLVISINQQSEGKAISCPITSLAPAHVSTMNSLLFVVLIASYTHGLTRTCFVKGRNICPKHDTNQRWNILHPKTVDASLVVHSQCSSIWRATQYNFTFMRKNICSSLRFDFSCTDICWKWYLDSP